MNETRKNPKKITDKIQFEQCDILSKLKGIDLQELLYELESFHLDLRTQLGLDSKITFGTEIEFENAIYNDVKKQLDQNFNNTWQLKYDETVSSSRTINNENISCGGEIVSPILKDKEETWQELQWVCQILQRLQARTKNMSGGHIHFGANYLDTSEKYWLNFIQLWIIYERIIYRFVFGDKIGPRERIMEYANPISQKLYKNFFKLRSNNYTVIKENLPVFRNQAINFKNTKGGQFDIMNTIEFRCPNSSINPVVWQNNVNLFGKILMLCKSDRYDKDLINRKLKQYRKQDSSMIFYQEIYLQEALEFCDLVFNNNVDKLYFLKQYLKSFEYQHNSDENIKQIVL